MFVFLLVMAVLIPFIMIFFGILFKYHPPKNINGVYGYRTSRSMQNQETWDFAQAYFAKICLFYGIITFVPSIVLMFVFKQDYYSASLWIVGMQIVVLFLSIIPVEKALKNNFNEDGRYK